MTAQEFQAASASGKIQVDVPDEGADGGASEPTTPSVPIEQFIPILTQLQSVQRCLTAAPTSIPKTFQDQIQFVFTGGNYYLYLYFNNQWNSFSVTGGSGVTQLLAGTGISISPGGGTGNVTITNSGITSVVAGSGVSVSTSSGAATVTNIGVTSIVAGTNISISGSTGAVTISASSGGAATAKFGGTGVDGALNISSGTTNFNLGGASVFIKNYTSISVTGTANITFTNPASTGTQIIFRSQGNVTWTSSANPSIDLGSLGSAGAAVNLPNTNGNTGSAFGPYAYQGTITAGTGGVNNNGGVSRGGGGGASMVAAGTTPVGAGSGTGGQPPTHIAIATNVQFMIWPAIPGSGGGGGGSNSGSVGDAAGGNGAGSFYCECAGALNITSIFNANGTAGGNSPISTVSGSGGGGGGAFIFLYNALTANTATFNVNGGAGGSASGSGFDSAGGAGANGFSAVVQNLIWV